MSDETKKPKSLCLTCLNLPRLQPCKTLTGPTMQYMGRCYLRPPTSPDNIICGEDHTPLWIDFERKDAWEDAGSNITECAAYVERCKRPDGECPMCEESNSLGCRIAAAVASKIDEEIMSQEIEKPKEGGFTMTAPTMELRWLVKKGGDRVLQQAWKCRSEEGFQFTKWKAVPMVLGVD